MTATAQPPRTAHIIRSDAEAIAVARTLAERFAVEASVRDRERRLPFAELDEFSASGLWGITIPKAYGGAGVSYVTVAEVIKIISAADSSLGQLPQNHLGVLDILLQTASEEQKRYYFAKVLQGYRFGNAFSEAGSKHAGAFETRIRFNADGARIDGEKFYCTGALFAHIVPAVAVDEENKAFIAFIERGSSGLTVIDSWDGFGQRTTASGGVTLDAVQVPLSAVIPAHRAFDEPTADGPISQIIQAAVDTGLAVGALEEAKRYARQSRPWIDSGQDHGWQDPFTIAAIGDLEWRVHGTEAILEKAGLAIDQALREPNEDTVAQASVVVAQAKVLSAESSLLASSKLFELAGTRSVLGKYNLDRYWRNARTHTLHDPARWKYHLIGNFLLNGVKPARHAWN
ncbi:SfnB family sulfur acquisition oxidoreductase [Pseudomonas chlororaphis]|uniref:Dibenzothiophene desulfurization enzyme C n=1 Tax=Pseudomonas chlororaphis TaxID=587753 RepID=A0AAX3G479_9PSED|nr:SfnB family sulfur acquisition oxidoreductase [Pseudomonas chlororaphis]AZC36952.1 Acyl-CoA dehydrogenase [Pseudomonas chlororaphis subsp. piscium]AZC43497.1 Acyl-CoA dehydrogenase [Pseudomonas chlororaphis subsp. piscium]WDG75366.1 SfnB family sulfur acquisition oxidoreductase [Pseudomonas chlororaphis]WDH26998.1 SfnB family sulfur acquisition oxidoreductase [Pseudomonas chlororaphis]WDH73886.1 SfnB family sulfur acquisition oxidoreductase [Pseudomonas chlororaphis]